MYYLRLFKQFCFRYWLVAALCYLVVLIIISPYQLKEEAGQGQVTVSGKIISQIEELPLQQEFLLQVESGSSVAKVIQVKVSRDFKLHKGETVKCSGKIHSLDYFLDYGTNLSINSCIEFEVIQKRETSVVSALSDLSEKLNGLIRFSLPEPHAALLQGLILGGAEQFPEAFGRNLERSGTLHIVSVSGFNVNFLAGLALSFAGIFKRKSVIIVSLLLLVCYWIMVGPENLPATRATISCVYYLIAQIFGVRADYLNAVGISMLLILLFFPWAIVNIGFYLSFSASLAIYTLKPAIGNLVKYDSPLIVLACFLGTTPWTVTIFKQLNLWAIPINILIAPFLPLIMQAALICLPLISFFPHMASIIVLPLEALLGIVIKLIMLVEKLPFNEIEVKTVPALMISIILVSICLFLIVRNVDKYLAK